MIGLGRVRLSCVDSGAYACILKRVLSLLAKLQLRNSMMLNLTEHALVDKPAKPVGQSGTEGNARKKMYYHYSLQVKRDAVPPTAVTDYFQVNGQIVIKEYKLARDEKNEIVCTKDDSVADAKGFRFKINQVKGTLSGSLDIFMPKNTELWVATCIRVTDGASLSQVLDLFRQGRRAPDTVAATLKLTFDQDKLLAELLVEPIVDGKHGTLCGIGMNLVACGVKPFTQEMQPH